MNGQDILPKGPGLLSRMLAFELALGALALFLAWLFGIALAPQFSGSWVHAILWGVVATLPMLMAMVWFEIGTAAWLVELRRFVQAKLVPLFDGIPAWGIALIALFAGVFEELLFRGVIQQGLDQWLGLWPALLITSLLFGLAHAMTWAYFVITAVMGVYFGLVFVWTDQLLVPMLAHFLYDWIVLVWLLRKR